MGLYTFQTFRDAYPKYEQEAEKCNNFPSYTCVIDENGRKSLAARTPEIARKEAEWNEWYNKAIDVCNKARKTRFLGLFGRTSDAMVDEMTRFGDELYDWACRFREYEFHEQLVVSDRPEYIIKGLYLGYYASHSVSFMQRRERGYGLYTLYTAYGFNTPGVKKRFTDLERLMMDLDFLNPKIIGFFNRITSKLFLKNKIEPMPKIGNTDMPNLSDTQFTGAKVEK